MQVSGARRVSGVTIEDTFAEAFPMWAARLVITAATPEWARLAGEAASGLATSIVGCGCEAGLERTLPPEETPDGRPGAAVLLFTVSREALADELLKRIGQGVMTAPTTACYNGLEGGEPLLVGGKIRYFGDGFQASKRIEGAQPPAGRRFWRVPVGDGEFLVEESFFAVQAVGGGNLLILGEDPACTLQAAAAAAEAVRRTPGAIAPFPGGVCRSPSKIGSRYAGLRASSNAPFCPTLRGRVDSRLPAGCHCCYEIVVDGLDETVVARAMQAGIRAVVDRTGCAHPEGGPQPGALVITAGNFGGKLGPYHIHLHSLLAGEEACR